MKSSYNTYLNTGFPPAPIASPGLESIRSAASPAQTDYFYYLHDSKGQIHYAKTVEEHNKKHTEAIDRWRDRKETIRNTDTQITKLTAELEAELKILMIPIRLGKNSDDDLVDYVIRTELNLKNREIVDACKRLVNFRTALERCKGRYILYIQPGIDQVYILGEINTSPAIIIGKNELSINTNGCYAKHECINYNNYVQLYRKNMPLFTGELDDYTPTKDGSKIPHHTWQSLINCLKKGKI